jgi:replicative DNA helicase
MTLATLTEEAPQKESTKLSAAMVRCFDETADTQAVASEGLDLEAEDFLHFPWPSLDKAIGGIGPNRIIIMAAPPEGGKTSFTLSLLDEWAESGVRIVAAFLETPPDEVVIQWACFRLGISYEDIATGAYLKRSDAEDVRAMLKNEIHTMAMRFYHNVWIHRMEALTATAVDALVKDSIQYDADVLVVDHLDHTDDTGSGARGLVESNAILSALKRGIRLARSGGSRLRAFATSQMNNDAVRRGGVFGRATPPLASDVFMGQKKEQICDLMLGLHRIRRPAMDGDKQMEDDIKAGRRPLSDMLLPNTIGVRIMKRRVGGGSNITIPLGFRRGRVVEPNGYSAQQDRSPDAVYEVT